MGLLVTAGHLEEFCELAGDDNLSDPLGSTGLQCIAHVVPHHDECFFLRQFSQLQVPFRDQLAGTPGGEDQGLLPQARATSMAASMVSVQPWPIWV